MARAPWRADCRVRSMSRTSIRFAGSAIPGDAAGGARTIITALTPMVLATDMDITAAGIAGTIGGAGSVSSQHGRRQVGRPSLRQLFVAPTDHGPDPLVQIIKQDLGEQLGRGDRAGQRQPAGDESADNE